ncbi:MAG: hypothetical protein COA45_00240 [Zetaproteobacteria bacterium]|nr:MAG: hypothetical protein COA45_00240 [Zetaproteobacteria bacterium]
MRHGTSNRRHRNRNNNNGNNGRRNNQPRTQVYDSNGPDVRIRGTAHQVAEKYLALAKDSTALGEHTIAENYFQHAEHYIRMINELSGAQEAKKVQGLDNGVVADDEGNRVEGGKPSNNVEPKNVDKSVDNVGKNVDEAVDLSLPSSILGPDVSVKSDVKETQQESESVD